MMDILPLLDELQIIARNGLNYAQNPYDRERYERLMELTARYYGEALDLPPADVRERLSKELGYVTPKVGADAAIFNNVGEILLVLRAAAVCSVRVWPPPAPSAAGFPRALHRPTRSGASRRCP
jgi:hypothetical protein